MLIRTQSVGPLLASVRARGGNADALARQFNLAADAAKALDVELEVSTLAALFDAAATLVDDPFLGVHAALSLQRGRYGLVEYGTYSAPTLGDALERLVRFSALINRAARYELVKERRHTRLVQRLPNLPNGLGRQCNEFNVVALLQMGRAAIRQAWAPHRVDFAHAAPPNVGELVKVLGTSDIRFHADGNGFLVDNTLLNTAVPTADPALLALMDRYGAQELAREPTGDGVVPHVRAQVQRQMAHGAPRLPEVARAMRMSPRTLQRRLGHEGLAFQDVVDGVRQEVARRHLGNGTPLAEVAFTLGFSDMGTFLRAFKRWTGSTPGQFRRGAVPRR